MVYYYHEEETTHSIPLRDIKYCVPEEKGRRTTVHQQQQAPLLVPDPQLVNEPLLLTLVVKSPRLQVDAVVVVIIVGSVITVKVWLWRIEAMGPFTLHKW